MRSLVGAIGLLMMVVAGCGGGGAVAVDGGNDALTGAAGADAAATTDAGGAAGVGDGGLDASAGRDGQGGVGGGAPAGGAAGGLGGAAGSGGAAGGAGVGGAAGMSGVGGAGGAAGMSGVGGAAGMSSVGGAGGAAGMSGVGGAGAGPVIHAFQTHSSSIATNLSGTQLYVVHPDGDSVTILDRASHEILQQVLLAAAPPAVNASGRYERSVGPRALAVNNAGTTLYVTGQRSGHLYAVDVATGDISRDAAVCSEPIGVVVSGDDADVFVACAQDDEVVELAAADFSVVATVPCPRKPWALAWAADGQTLLATHFLGPGISAFGTQPLAHEATWTVPDVPPTGDPLEPHGQVRGLYDAAIRPGTSELWVVHLMLGTNTAQPLLDFQNTVFPVVSVLNGDSGAPLARLSVQGESGDGNAFFDIVSGPHALTFSPDGKLAFVVDTDSEDVLVIDAQTRLETQLLYPLQGHLPEGIVWAGGEIYVQERNSEDIAAFTVDTSSGLDISADGDPFPTVAIDPMPATLRLGQRLFYSANSDQYPITQHHWVACSSCHLEGRSDAVTWDFTQGPRDTPTNAGGMLDTGFQFRTADRNQVQDYWHTINVEQGGMFDATDPDMISLLNVLADYVNEAIPIPVPPSTDATHTLRGQALADLRAQGATVFDQLGCANCHSGPAYTDSGADNPTLDLTGPVVSTPTPGGVLLHDVGTCVISGPFPDVAHTDEDGDARDPCAFDTPALRGLADSAPYLHDGSAATLNDVLPVMLKAAAGGGTPATLSSSDQQALVEFLRSL